MKWLLMKIWCADKEGRPASDHKQPEDEKKGGECRMFEKKKKKKPLQWSTPSWKAPQLRAAQDSVLTILWQAIEDKPEIH